MGHISALFIDKIATTVASRSPTSGRWRGDVFQVAGLDPDAPPPADQMISDSAFFDVLEWIAHEVPDGRSIPVEVGASMRCDDYGAFGLAFKSAVDLRGSFLRVERYGRVVTSIANFDVIPGDTTTLMAVRRDAGDRAGLRLTNELAVSAATALSREVFPGEFAPVAVYFSHDTPEDMSVYEAHFRCPVQFDAGRDGLEVAEADLRLGNRLGDEGISGFFDSHLEKELAGYVSNDSLEGRIRQFVARSLSEGVPTVTDVASHLNVGGRTLQRQLAQSGHTYQDIVDSARRELAERLLNETEFALTEIAFLTGYAEQSTFTRAFRRWHGVPPTDYRRNPRLN